MSGISRGIYYRGISIALVSRQPLGVTDSTVHSGVRTVRLRASSEAAAVVVVVFVVFCVSEREIESRGDTSKIEDEEGGEERVFAESPTAAGAVMVDL